MKRMEDIKYSAGARGKAGMTVPEGFFEQMQARIEQEVDRYESQKALEAGAPAAQSRLNTESHARGGVVVPMWRRWAVAACAVLVLAVGGVVYHGVTGSEAPVANDMMASVETTTDDSHDVYDAEKIMVESVNDYDLYDLYCDIY